MQEVANIIYNIMQTPCELHSCTLIISASGSAAWSSNPFPATLQRVIKESVLFCLNYLSTGGSPECYCASSSGKLRNLQQALHRYPTGPKNKVGNLIGSSCIDQYPLDV